MSLHQPSAWWLAALLTLPLIWWWHRRRPQQASIGFSSLAPLRRAGASWATQMRWIVPALRTSALVLLIVSLARPQIADERTRIRTEGVAIQLVVDRSGSMLALDFERRGQPIDRLTAVKDVVEDFIDGGEDLPGRPDDLIGLISFATYADANCPLTIDHDHLVEAVRQVEVAPGEQDRATAIGDAIALGVERLRGLEERADLGAAPIKSRVMILLTDGESNAGVIEPLVAADLAAAFDVKIYTIGAGTASGVAPMPTQDVFGRRVMRTVPVSIDEETLRAIADRTGGQYFRATDRTSLGAVYAKIDELERTEIEQTQYTEYAEPTVESVALGRVTLPPLLAIVFVLLSLEIVCRHTRFRRLP